MIDDLIAIAYILGAGLVGVIIIVGPTLAIVTAAKHSRSP